MPNSIESLTEKLKSGRYPEAIGRLGLVSSYGTIVIPPDIVTRWGTQGNNMSVRDKRTHVLLAPAPDSPLKRRFIYQVSSSGKMYFPAHIRERWSLGLPNSTIEMVDLGDTLAVLPSGGLHDVAHTRRFDLDDDQLAENIKNTFAADIPPERKLAALAFARTVIDTSP